MGGKEGRGFYSRRRKLHGKEMGEISWEEKGGTIEGERDISCRFGQTHSLQPDHIPCGPCLSAHRNKRSQGVVFF